MNDSYLDHTSISPNFGTYAAFGLNPKCVYANVWFAYQIEGKKYAITQGCCNHWDCPRCGQIRAKVEYAHIVYGIHELSQAGEPLYFQTLTCRGKDLTMAEADRNYLQWTNKLLDSYRERVKKSGQKWSYVQVTERQKRGHPHSHLLTTFAPDELYVTVIWKYKNVQGKRQWVEEEVLRSYWLDKACPRSGLGDQYDLSPVRDERAASRYVAKYMFKKSNFTADWPKKWRRVRYSQSFPKLPELKTDAFVLRTYQDWNKLGEKAAIIIPRDEEVEEYAAWKLIHHDCIVLHAEAHKERDKKQYKQ